MCLISHIYKNLITHKYRYIFFFVPLFILCLLSVKDSENERAFHYPLRAPTSQISHQMENRIRQKESGPRPFLKNFEPKPAEIEA